MIKKTLSPIQLAALSRTCRTSSIQRAPYVQKYRTARKPSLALPPPRPPRSICLFITSISAQPIESGQIKSAAERYNPMPAKLINTRPGNQRDSHFEIREGSMQLKIIEAAVVLHRFVTIPSCGKFTLDGATRVFIPPITARRAEWRTRLAGKRVAPLEGRMLSR